MALKTSDVVDERATALSYFYIGMCQVVSSGTLDAPGYAQSASAPCARWKRGIVMRRWWQSEWRPSPAELGALVRTAIETSPEVDRARRAALGDDLRRTAIRAWERQKRAASRKYTWHIGMRVLPAAAAVSASAAGGTLIGGLHGGAATTVGVIAIVSAVLGAAGTALRLDDEFDYQGRRSKEMEKIGWLLLSSISLDLPSKGVDDLRHDLTEFQMKIAEIVNMQIPLEGQAGQREAPPAPVRRQRRPMRHDAGRW
jgi:hypothetical protein